jgi:hypothetical protein
VSWRIYAAAQVPLPPTRAGYTTEAHATLYLVPGGGLNLRAKAGEELLLDGFYDSVPEALLEAAFSGLPQPLYDALLDAVARREAGER